MKPETIEAFAIRAALGNNGGGWATHYTEEQKEHWRQFIRDFETAIIKEMCDGGWTLVAPPKAEIKWNADKGAWEQFERN